MSEIINTFKPTNYGSKIRISSDDTTQDFLEDKIQEGSGIILTKNNSGANEILTASVDTSYTSKFLSAGVYDSPSFTNHGSGLITVGKGTYLLYSTSDYNGSGLLKYTLPETNLELELDTTNYVVADYNSGIPVVKNITDVSQILQSNTIPIFSIYRTSDHLHRLDWDELGKGLANKLSHRQVKTHRFEIEPGGLQISEVATRLVNVTGGIIWYGGAHAILLQCQSDTCQMHYYYHSGGEWTSSVVTQYENFYYDDGTDLVEVHNNDYTISWIYRVVDQDSEHLVMLAGTDNYAKLSSAQAAQPPITVPGIVANFSLLVGRIIVEKNASIASTVESSIGTTFSFTGVANHNDLANIDGGTVDEYYHLTLEQHTDLTDGGETELHTHDHDTLVNFDLNKHIDHTQISIIGQSGIVGSGTIDSNITLTFDASSVNHNSLDNVDLAQSGITYGHIDDQTQVIKGTKAFFNIPISSGIPTTDYQLTNKKYTDDTFQLVDSDLTAISGLSAFGIAVRTDTGVWATRTIEAGSGITITDGSGIAGNITITNNISDLEDINDVTILSPSIGDALIYDGAEWINGRAALILASSDFEDQGDSVNYTLHGNPDGNPSWSPIVEDDILLSNNATNNVSTARHGFTPILPDNPSQYLNGEGNWVSPSGVAFDNGYLLTSFSGQTEVNIVHNFNTYPVVQCLNNFNTQFIPLSVVNNSLNDFTVSFSIETTGSIIASVGSPQPQEIISVSSAYTVLTTDRIIDVTSSGIIITLPTAIGNIGREFIVDNLSEGDIIVSGVLGQTIQSEVVQYIPPDSAMNIYAFSNTGWRVY